MTVNSKIVEALGVESPEENEDLENSLVKVDPHEINKVNNPNMPDVYDIDEKQVVGDKQLEKVIGMALKEHKDMYSESKSVDPKYRARHVEVANGTLNIALDAIKTKLNTQEKRRQQRMKEAEFGMNGKNIANVRAENIYFNGSREDLLNSLPSIDVESNKEEKNK